MVAVVIRVVVAEDSYFVREGVRLLLDEADGIELIDTCGDLPGLLAAVESHAPDVVVTDIRMPPTGTDEGIRAADEFRRSHPAVGVVVLSQYVEPDYALRLFADGSRGRAYLLKERVSEIGQLAAAITTVAGGGSMMDPKVIDALVDARSRTSVLDRLTPRETEVMAEVAAGRTNAGIADALVISERAVEKHINSILTKLDLPPDTAGHRRVHAVLLWLAEQGGQ